jgi:predicted permease
MQALTTLFPVFFMLALGFICRQKGWITPAQKDGANAIVFNILFPILIFNLVCSASIEMDSLKIVGYVLVMFILAIVVGKLVAKKLDPKHAHFIPYLLSCIEGGNVALPLYLSIVGASSNTVIYDLAGTCMAFMIVPVLVAKEASSSSSAKEMIKNIFSNTFVITVILALFLNLTGLYSLAINSAFGDMITATFSTATQAIVPMILFILGFDLSIDKETIGPILKVAALKTIYFAIVIAGFFLLFPTKMADKTYMMAPIIYFMSPTGFGLFPVISPLYKDEDDASFTSAFVSIYLIITLIVYTAVVLFIA